MYLTQYDIEQLKTDKAKNARIAWRKLYDYCYTICVDSNIRFKNNLHDGMYAHHIEITSSGNESRVYGFVYDDTGELIASANILDNSPAAYAEVARYCGTFLEAFNKYCYINDI